MLIRVLDQFFSKVFILALIWSAILQRNFRGLKINKINLRVDDEMIVDRDGDTKISAKRYEKKKRHSLFFLDIIFRKVLTIKKRK